MHDAIYRRVLTLKTIMVRRAVRVSAVQLFATPIGKPNGTSLHVRCKRWFSQVSIFPYLENAGKTTFGYWFRLLNGLKRV